MGRVLGANAGLGASVDKPIWRQRGTRRQGGEFASLAARITPPASQPDAAKRIIDVGEPGFVAAAALLG
jgi:hypothetical protein